MSSEDKTHSIMLAPQALCALTHLPSSYDHPKLKTQKEINLSSGDIAENSLTDPVNTRRNKSTVIGLMVSSMVSS